MATPVQVPAIRKRHATPIVPPPVHGADLRPGALRGGEVSETTEGALFQAVHPLLESKPELRPPLHHPVRLRLSLLLFATVWLLVLSVQWVINGGVENQWISWYLSIVWSLYLPLAVIGLIGAARTRKLETPPVSEAAQQLVIFFLPTIAREDTMPALDRVVNSILRHAPAALANFRVDIVIDEGAECEQKLRTLHAGSSLVNVVTVPAAYHPVNGTRFKARANEYARLVRAQDGEDRSDVFVYHLDDDTAIGPDTVAAIADFLLQDDGTYHVAQGVLTFPHELSPSFLSRMADSIRPADDLTRFFFFTGLRGSPLGGLHGEHLLIRASIEDEIGWDFGPNVKVEDAYFALRFSERYPQRSTFLPAYTYGASPSSVGDFIKQRRRWAGGLYGLVLDRSIPFRLKVPLTYSVLLWMSGLFQYIGILLPVLFLTTGIVSTSPISPLLIGVWSFNFSFLIWMYVEGLRINLDVSKSPRHLLPASLSLLGSIFIISAMEASASALGAIDVLRGKNDFAVISKRQ